MVIANQIMLKSILQTPASRSKCTIRIVLHFFLLEVFEPMYNATATFSAAQAK